MAENDFLVAVHVTTSGLLYFINWSVCMLVCLFVGSFLGVFYSSHLLLYLFVVFLSVLLLFCFQMFVCRFVCSVSVYFSCFSDLTY